MPSEDLRPRGGAFALLLGSVGFANLADGMVGLALLWLATDLSGTLVGGSLVLFAWKTPWLLLSVPAGTLVDRMTRPVLIVATDAGRALILGVLTLGLFLLGGGQAEGGTADAMLLGLAAAGFALGFLEVVRDVAAQSFVPALVPDHRLEAANAAVWSVELGTLLMLAPLLATPLYEIGAHLPLLACTGLFGAAAVAASGLLGRDGVPRERAAPGLGALAEGWRHLSGEPLLVALSALTALWNVVFYGLAVVAVYVAQVELALSPVEYGRVLIVAAAGALAGAMSGPLLVRRLGARRVATGLFAAATLAVMTMAATGSAPVFAAGLAVVYYCGPVWNTISVTTRQRRVPPRLLGRVIGVHRTFALGAAALSPLVVGAIGAAAEASGHADLQHLLAFALFALAGTLATAVCAVSPALRTLGR